MIRRSLFFGVLAVAFWVAPVFSQTPPTFLGMWGSQGTGPGQFQGPTGIAVDPSGVVWVADPGRIQSFTPEGVFLTQWPTGTTDFVVGIAADGLGRIFMITQSIQSSAIHYLHTFTTSGTLQSTEWIHSGGCHCSARVAGPAVTPGGDLFWADWARYTFFGNPGNPVDTVAKVCGSPCWEVEPLELVYPGAVAVDPAGFVYVTDISLRRVQKYTTDGTFITQWGMGSSLVWASGAAVGPNGDVFVTNYAGVQVLQFTSGGTLLTSWGSSGSGPGQFNGPYGVAVSSSGDIYVTDRGNHRVQRFGDPAVSTVRGSWGRLKSLYR